MTCHEIRELLATRRHLSFAQERAVQTHLAACADCTTRWQHEERILQQFRALLLPAGALPETRKQAIRQTLLTQHPARRLQKRRTLIGGIAFALIVLLCVFRSEVRQVITQTVGVGDLMPQPAAVFPTRAGASETLYIASAVTDASAQNSVGARVTAVDLATWQERYRVEGADEAALSPDGTRLYVAGRLPEASNGDALRALDARTGRELWRTPIMHRAAYPGQANLVVSPDALWLYIRSYDPARGQGDASTVPFWLQVIDTATGSMESTTIALPSITICGSPTLASPPVGQVIYISCYYNHILAVNTHTQQIEPLIPEAVTGAILSPNDREMYAVNTVLEVFILDSVQRTLIRKNTLRPQLPFSLSNGLIAVSGDGSRLMAGQTIEGRPGTDTACEIRIFDLHTAAEIGGFQYERPLQSFAMNATGTRLYAGIGGMTNDTIIEFDVPSGTVHAEHHRPQEVITRLFVGR